MRCGRYVIEPRWCTHTHKLSASLAPRSASRALCQSPAVSPRGDAPAPGFRPAHHELVAQ
eukprot:scaffold53381_cov62-Phaeocystis_antarctica.AAC.4